MLALATAPRYRDPWAPAPEDARPVSLVDLMIEADLHVRNYVITSRIRALMGLPTTAPGLEKTLQDLKLWPAGARPLAVDVSLILHGLPEPHRTAVYGRLAGLSLPGIAKQMGVRGTVFVTLNDAAEILNCAAVCFGVHPDTSPDDLVGKGFVWKAMGGGLVDFHTVSQRLRRIPWVYCEADACRQGCTREDFMRVWVDDINPHCDGIRGI